MPKPKNKFDQAHLRNQQKYQKQIDEIYRLAVNEAAAIGVSIKDFDPDTIFSFSDFPQASKRADELVADLRKQIDTCLVNGIRSEWTLANNKNNELCNQVFGDNVGKLSREEYRRYYSTNGKALDAFLERKEAGLNLSDRVWRYSDAFRNEIEMGLDLGIREGLDAAEMARDLQTYLKHPDKLFRRVRDEHGVLHLSKAASQFHPGRGVYRSSYLNARRLAATETNIAYRTADHLRWQNMDFVVGIKIQLSNNHNCKGVPAGMFFDICDELKGNYPKDFKFTGWHPHCRCYATPILKTPEEIAADNERIMRGEEPLEQSIEDLEFKDNSRSVIDKISAPYDKMINSDYRVGMPLDDYASGSDEINNVARFGKLRRKSYNSNNVEDWKDAIKSLDDVMDRLPRLPQNVDLFRASSTLADFPIKGKSIEEINKHIGEKFVDKGFTSFSFSRKYVEKASDADDFIIVFKAKKGLKGASLANTSSFNAVERQEEFLVARNTEYKILGAKEVKGKKYLFVGEGDEAVAATKRITDVPDNFKDWLKENKDRAKTQYSVPYFLRDNERFIPKDYIKLYASRMPYETYSEYEAAMRFNKKNAAFTPEQRANIRELNKVMPVTQGKIMNFTEADGEKVNPHFKGGNDGYTKNCGTCVPAYLLRRRGFNVNAGKWIDGEGKVYSLYENGVQIWKRADGSTIDWVDNEVVKYDGWAKGRTHNQSVSLKSFIENNADEPGIYMVRIGWNRGGGHFTVVELTADKNYIYYDPQSGKKKWLNLWESQANVHNCWMMRIDDKLIDPDFAECFVKAE